MKSAVWLDWVGVGLVVTCLMLTGCPAASDGGSPTGSGQGETTSGGGSNGGGSPVDGTNQGGGGGSPPASMTMTSTAFSNGGAIPLRYASSYAGGQDVSPPLAWAGLPAGTAELALIMEDADVFAAVHWLIYKIPASSAGLPEGIPAVDAPSNPAGAIQGANLSGGPGYYGPEPPPGDPAHHYYFRLYALDAPLSVGAEIDRYTLDAAMQGHILGQAELMGTFAQ